jgi:WD40 repeat protein
MSGLTSSCFQSVNEIKSESLEPIFDPLDASFNWDGSSLIVAGFRDGAAVVEASSGTTIAVPFGPQSPAVTAAMQPHGPLLVVGYYNGSTWIETVDREKPANILEGHERPVWIARFNKDGDRLATASADGSAIVYSNSISNRVTHARLVLRGHEQGILSLSFSDDGDKIVTVANEEPSALLWSLSSKNDNFFLREMKLSEFDRTFRDTDGDFMAPTRETTCVNDVGSCEHQTDDLQWRMWHSVRGSDFLIRFLASETKACLGPVMRAILGTQVATSFLVHRYEQGTLHRERMERLAEGAPRRVKSRDAYVSLKRRDHGVAPICDKLWPIFSSTTQAATAIGRSGSPRS